MMAGLNHEQVAQYNQALTPEMRRITENAQGRWGKEQLMHMSKVVNCGPKFPSGGGGGGGSVKASFSRKSETSSSSSASRGSANGKAALDESGIGMGMEDVVQMAKKSPSDRNKK